MATISHEKPKGGFIERGLRWDEHFNRRLGIVATGAAGVLMVFGAPAVAGIAAMVAGGNFVAAEIDKRLVTSLDNRRTGKK